MTDSYRDIINMEKPFLHHIRMSLYDRAVQFAPFASLTGFDAQISETARLTDKKPELSSTEIERLNEKTRLILNCIQGRPLLEVTYFIKDERKDGGMTGQYTGRIRKIDAYNRVFIFEDCKIIPADDIIDIKSETINFMDDTEE